MNAERLLAHYEKIADGAEAIARLRRLVLDLAVRGKLASQDATDEPASELLKRITKEKARLAKAGEIRKPRVLPEVENPPFDLPQNWRWTPIREVASDRGQEIPQSTFTYIDVTAIDKEAGVVADPKVLEPSEAPSRARKITRKGDVIYSCVRPYLLNVAVIETDFDPQPVVSTAFAILNGHGLVLPRYLWIVLRSPFMVERVEENQRGQAYPAINDTDFAVLPFPLPPLAEQRRIVTKVGELMGLCDRLEVAWGSQEALRDRLAAASLARLNAPDPETFQADARFTLDALPALTTRPDQLKALRQTILSLAMRGKLVPQDERALSKDVELETLATIVRGSSPRPKGDRRYYEGPVPRLLIADITRDGKYVTPRIDSLTIEGAKLSRPMPKGSLVLAISGSYGVPAFLAVDACIHDGFIGFRDVSPLLDAEYLFLVMQFRRPYFDEVVKDSGLKNLTTEHLKRLIVPLFDLNVQRRIVAKVDALMALCDQLETSLIATAATRRCLLDALVAEALVPAEDREMEAAE